MPYTPTTQAAIAELRVMCSQHIARFYFFHTGSIESFPWMKPPKSQCKFQYPMGSINSNFSSQ